MNPFTDEVQGCRSDLLIVTQLASYGAKNRKSCSLASQHFITLTRRTWPESHSWSARLWHSPATYKQSFRINIGQGHSVTMMD